MKKKQTILIVDDDQENLKILGDFVVENGYIPGFAEGGNEALVHLKNSHPDLILLDIMMPDMDGFEVCRRIKQDATLADIPIIFLSAKTAKEDVIAGLKLGAVDYVTKPFNQEELLTRVNTHLELQAAKEDLREALIEKEKALVEKEVALNTKDKLFSIIGHDLGNIFGGLQTLVQALAREKIRPDTKERYIRTLLQSASNGYDLLTNLLNWSRSQTGELQVNLTTLVLQDLIHRSIKLQLDKAERKEIDIIALVDENTTVFTDENMLDTVLRNLISNAIKFTQKSGTVRITTKIENNQVEISITDTGVGIKSENIDELFNANVSHTFGTAGEKGNGFGLALCKELVEKCDGTIGVESEVGKGSRFYVRLPVNGK